MHGVPALTYDEDLAASAQAWADTVDQTGNFAHSNSGNGENLAYYNSSNPSQIIAVLKYSSHATDAWYDEINEPGYNFDNPGFTSGAGHFTQVVWKDTERIGCGISGNYVVCQYDPAGNNLGFDLNGETNFAANVLPLIENAEMVCAQPNDDEGDSPDEEDQEGSDEEDIDLDDDQEDDDDEEDIDLDDEEDQEGDGENPDEEDQEGGDEEDIDLDDDEDDQEDDD